MTAEGVASDMQAGPPARAPALGRERPLARLAVLALAAIVAALVIAALAFTALAAAIVGGLVAAAALIARATAKPVAASRHHGGPLLEGRRAPDGWIVEPEPRGG
jgi:hypothetical protein